MRGGSRSTLVEVVAAAVSLGLSIVLVDDDDLVRDGSFVIEKAGTIAIAATKS